MIRTISNVVAISLLWAAFTFPSQPAYSQTADLVDRTALRVCADPANLPFSNDRRQGYENKLADLLGQELGVPVLYTWFPQATGFIRNTLRARKCDIVMGYAQGHELVQNTNHYFRSSYVLIYRKNSDLDGIKRIDDARLRDRPIGVIAGTPPATILALKGMIHNAKPFPLLVDRRHSSPAQDMVGEIADGKLDAGLLWGPIAGYYVKNSGTPLAMMPLTEETTGPRLVYRITFGIRPGEPDWKHQLNDFIAENQGEINQILQDFGVPLLDEQDQLIAQREE